MATALHPLLCDAEVRSQCPMCMESKTVFVNLYTLNKSLDCVPVVTHALGADCRAACRAPIACIRSKAMFVIHAHTFSSRSVSGSEDGLRLCAVRECDSSHLHPTRENSVFTFVIPMFPISRM